MGFTFTVKPANTSLGQFSPGIATICGFAGFASGRLRRLSCAYMMVEAGRKEYVGTPSTLELVGSTSGRQRAADIFYRR